MKKIIFIELNQIGPIHLPINSCILQIFSHIFNNRVIQIFGEQQHINLLVKYCEQNNINLESKNNIYVHKTGGINVLLRDLISCFILFKIINSRTNRDDIIILLSAMPICHLVAKLANFFFKRDAILILHSELEYIQSSKLSYKFMTLFLKIALKFKSRHFYYTILSPIILKNFEIIYGIKLKNVFVIDHPYVFPEILNEEINISKSIFSSIGVASSRKNSNYLFVLSEELESEIKDNKLIVQHIGTISNDLYKENYSNVNIIGGAKMLNRAQFDSYLSKITYALFFYGNEMYKLTASGALLDAISYEKPIIAIRNDYFSYYFTKLGNIGYLVDNIEEMVALIRKIATFFPKNEYQLQKDNLSKAKEFFLIETSERQIRSQIKNYTLQLKVV